MGRTTSFDEDGNKKGEWTAEEDQILAAYVSRHGVGDWRSLPNRAGLKRCGKSCRLRWMNYLKPGIKKGKFSPEEDRIIIQLHADMGNRWAAMARHLPNRTDNDIKNHWNACLRKQLYRAGIDPVTHKPLISNPSSSSSSPSTSSSSRSNGSGSTHFLNKLAAKISERRRIGELSLDYVGRLKEMVLDENGNGNGDGNDDLGNENADVMFNMDDDAVYDGGNLMDDVSGDSGLDAMMSDQSGGATWFDQSFDVSSVGVYESFIFDGHNAFW